MAATATIVTFVLGIANFALSRAVLESGHPLIRRLPPESRVLGRRMALGSEFLVLLMALLLAANGWSAAAWGYLAYTLFNAVAGWLILSGKV